MTRLNKAFAIFSVFCGLVACGPDGGNASTESGPSDSAASAADGGTQPSASGRTRPGPRTPNAERPRQIPKRSRPQMEPSPSRQDRNPTS